MFDEIKQAVEAAEFNMIEFARLPVALTAYNAREGCPQRSAYSGGIVCYWRRLLKNLVEKGFLA